MTSLSFADIFLNATHFNSDDALLRRTCNLFCGEFLHQQIRYFIIGGFALIFHGCLRNTMDVDIVVDENGFQKAVDIISGLGFDKVINDGLVASFTHRYLLSVDVLIATTYASIPSEKNSINDDGIFFCDLPTLISTKIQGYMGRPKTKQAFGKKHEVD